MLRVPRLALGLVVVLSVAVGEARAQSRRYYYPRGYGAYGWGGWGGTVQGSIARGLGYYAMGAGAYNRQTAIANSINANTVMRWNQYMYLSQMEANRREYLRMARRQRRDSQSGELLYQRFRDNPTPGDIEHGDALNVILDQLTNPTIQSSALRLITDKLGGDVVDEIPFVHASDAVTLSLNQLTSHDGWPIALRSEAFAPERKAYQDAVAKALDEDQKGDLSPQTAQEVRAAASRLWAKLHASPVPSPSEQVEAENYVKGLIGISRMLDKPEIDKVIGELEQVKTTSLGSLLAFMHAYNLRFGPATTPRQRAVYQELYPKMATARDRILKEAGGKNDSATAKNNTGKPTDFFQAMHLEHLEGKAGSSDKQP